MSLLISASALMHIQQQFGDKARCEVTFRDNEATIVVDDGVRRYQRIYDSKEVFQMSSGQILMDFEKAAKHYFAGSE